MQEETALILEARELRLFHAGGLGGSAEASALMLVARGLTLTESTSATCLLNVPQESSPAAAVSLTMVQRWDLAGSSLSSIYCTGAASNDMPLTLCSHESPAALKIKTDSCLVFWFLGFLCTA